ncbi:MAG TPA: hypothetical protein VGN01_12775 [Acidobacteriaceae bacterium]|jgi:hypothetical protein
MEMEMNDSLGATIDRLTAAAGQLEQTVERLEEKLVAAEQKIAALEARAASATEAGAPSFRAAEGGGRKTLPTAMTSLLAKQGVTLGSLDAASLEAGALDAALTSLSLEQRIAVKAQLLRAGLLS